ncbi:MAG: DUF2795 domain-containing protein [Myxococcota bacterium]|nr:DUF2795 domain-containing protein [Myxococcota bacterium]
MAFGEDAALSPSTHLDGVTYPVTRDILVRTAADGGAPVEVINLFKSLPGREYRAKEDVMRDFAEAARRMAMHNSQEDDQAVRRDRRNLGRDLVEGAPDGMTRHP